MNELILRNNMKVLRAKNDLTQEQLSELVNVTRTTINFVERGKWVPSAVLAMKIARVFKAPFEEVFYFEDSFEPGTVPSHNVETLNMKK